MMRRDRDHVLGTELNAERGLAVGGLGIEGLGIEGLGIAAAFPRPERKYHAVWLLTCNNNELRREMSRQLLVRKREQGDGRQSNLAYVRSSS